MKDYLQLPPRERITRPGPSRKCISLQSNGARRICRARGPFRPGPIENRFNRRSTVPDAPWPAPQVHADAWVAASAVLIGDVQMAAGSSLWPTAVARGDVCPIQIGESSNVQDGAILHGDPGQPVTIGAFVTIGHRAVIHGATIEDGCLIGIGAIVLNGVTVGAGSLVAAGSVVTRDVLPASLVMGAPAQLKRQLSSEAMQQQCEHARRYRQLAMAHAGRSSQPGFP